MTEATQLTKDVHLATKRDGAPKRTILLRARGEGKTIAVGMAVADRLVRHPDERIQVVSHTRIGAKLMAALVEALATDLLTTTMASGELTRVSRLSYAVEVATSTTMSRARFDFGPAFHLATDAGYSEFDATAVFVDEITHLDTATQTWFAQSPAPDVFGIGTPCVSEERLLQDIGAPEAAGFTVSTPPGPSRIPAWKTRQEVAEMQRAEAWFLIRPN